MTADSLWTRIRRTVRGLGGLVAAWFGRPHGAIGGTRNGVEATGHLYVGLFLLV